MTHRECRIMAAVLGLTFLACPAFADPDPSLATLGGDLEGTRAVQWLYDSPLCVQETITDLGGGQYQYSYSFFNNDTNHIWHFGVWATFPSASSPTEFVQHLEWNKSWNVIADLYPEYDATNLDPNIAIMTSTWSLEWQYATDPINPGEFVSGFSFVAPAYDNSPKYYFYETLESGYVVEDGFLAAVGTTSSGPSAVENASWGGIKALYR